jgi:hypothetical protein
MNKKRTVDEEALSHLFKKNILCAFPQDAASHFSQMVSTIDKSEKVIACQLSNFAGEAGTSIGKEDLGLAIAAWIE